MKKFLSLLLAAALLLGCPALPAAAVENGEPALSWNGAGTAFAYQLGGGWLCCVEHSDHITIYDSQGLTGEVTVPDTLRGKPVTELYFCSVGYDGNPITYQVFGHAGITALTLPDTLTALTVDPDSRAVGFFTSNTLKEVVFSGDGPETLPKGTFGGCTALERVVLPKKVKTIEGAFAVPGEFDTMGAPLTTLKEIVVDEASPYLVKDDQGLIYDKEKTVLVTAAEGAAQRETVTLPATVKEISVCAFGGNGRLKKILGAEGVLSVEISALAGCDELNPFLDTYGRWCEEAATWAAVYRPQEGADKLFSGVSLLRFGPDVKVTRGMMAALLFRMEGQPQQLWGRPFPDVPANAYYAKAIRWAKDAGIVSGYRSGNFGPEDKVSRQDLVCMLYRYAQYKELDVSASDDLTRFADSGKVDGYALEAVKWAVGKGLLTGKGNDRLDPAGTATRAEAAVLFRKLAALQENK